MAPADGNEDIARPDGPAKEDNPPAGGQNDEAKSDELAARRQEGHVGHGAGVFDQEDTPEPDRMPQPAAPSGKGTGATEGAG